jgi:hypothetical protein
MVRIGEQVFYRMTDEESEKNNWQSVAPAIVLAVFENEYYSWSGRTGDNAVGLNLKVFTDGETDLLKRSVMKGDDKGQYFLKLENPNVVINVKVDEYVSDSTSISHIS